MARSRYTKLRNPDEFVHAFETGGWEQIERLYPVRTATFVKWIALTGAKCRMPRKPKVD